MKAQLERLTFNIELGRGEKLTLPATLINSVGEGRWTITVQPADDTGDAARDHSAFLDSYSTADEGLHDDCQRRRRVDAEIAAYAAEHAGTEFDLDPQLEEAGLECLNRCDAEKTP